MKTDSVDMVLDIVKVSVVVVIGFILIKIILNLI